jgi:hypothetical protein
MQKSALWVALFALLPTAAWSQSGYWQNHVDYTLNIALEPKDHSFTGWERLKYTNNSPDTLREVYYHLYFNAFQPESMMDVRSRTISDPDGRVKDRISKLRPEEVGRQTVSNLKQNGVDLYFETQNTVLRAVLAQPLLPGQSTELTLGFSGQVPVQIRRSGRNNKEGVDYSMAQWYPKLAVYDRHGWHPDPYVGREFYGDFGTFEVNIGLPATYVVGATGVEVPAIVNEPIPSKGRKANKEVRWWRFVAENVHDFVWAADPEFVHKKVQIPNGPLLQFYHLPDAKSRKHWDQLAQDAPLFFAFMAEKFGPYAYPQFSVIQGGDGGMEYPMATLMLAQGDSYEGFLGLFAHETCHAWFHGMLGTNEQAYSWMDEGFATFAEDEVMNVLTRKMELNPHTGSLRGYLALRKKGVQEPLTTPADLYDVNFAYSVASYSMGSLFLVQLRNIVGEDAFWATMRAYYEHWKFKHPEPSDFIRLAERKSGMELDWYLALWIGSTKGIDYAVEGIQRQGAVATGVTLRRVGNFPMPFDVEVHTAYGAVYTYHVPLSLAQKQPENRKSAGGRAIPTVVTAWDWTHPTYTFPVGVASEQITRVVVDPHQWMADVDRKNNIWMAPVTHAADETAPASEKAPD